MQVMPAVMNVMKEDATLVTLIKPQFEARRSQVKFYTVILILFLFSHCPVYIGAYCFISHSNILQIR